MFVYHKEDNVHIFAGVTSQGDAMAASYFLHKCVNVLNTFLVQGSIFRDTLETKDIIREAIMIQEILDEMVDNGDIVTTDPEVLKLFVQSGQPSLKKMQDEQVTIQATKQSNHRRQGIRYEKNQIYVDCVEKVNCMMSSVGQLLHADVQGSVEVNC